MLARQKNCRIPFELVPKFPVCGGDMEVNLRCDSFFVEDEAWHHAAEGYERFIRENSGKRILFLELGVGRMTPMFIQEPFWNMTLSFPHARYIAINNKYDFLPKQLEDKGMTIVADIAQVLRDARDTMDSGDNDR